MIDAAVIGETLRRARESPRRRCNYNFHDADSDELHRFLNVLLQGTYVAPHRHVTPPKGETFLLLEGTAAVVCFDDAGSVTDRILLGGPEAVPKGWRGGGFGVDVGPAVWHTITALSPHAVCFEVKLGPWDPATDKEFAPWAPREGEAGAAAYLDRILRAPAAD